MVADLPSSQHVFYAANASLLSGFVDEVGVFTYWSVLCILCTQLVKSTCVEINGVQPSDVCLGQGTYVMFDK